MRKIYLLLTLILIVGAFAGQEVFQLDDEPALFRELVPESLITYPPVRMWTLDNGLPVLFWENHTAPVVSSRITVKTGSMFEDKYLGTGISHNLEHIVSGGTTSRMTETEYKELLSSIGAYSNAYTNRTVTCYYINGPSEHFATELHCLADWVKDCVFDSVELAREKGVITQEIYKGKEEPHRVIAQLFSETVFKVHTARFPTIGYVENFLEITRDDLIDYYNDHYTPDNCILAIAGDLTLEEAQNYVDSFFGDWERQPHTPHTLPEEPAQLTARYSEVAIAVQTCNMRIGWRGAPRGHKDSWALDILPDILTDGKTSRLYKRLVTEEQLCGSVSAYHYNPHEQSPLFTININDFDYQDRDRILEILWEEIEKIKDKGIKPRELERQKRLLVKALMFENETVENQTLYMTYTYINYGRPYAIDFLVPFYMDATVDDIQRVTRDYILPNTMSIALLHPPLEKEEKVVEAKGEAGIQFEKRVLDNGMTVLVAENHNVSHIDVTIFFNAGVRYDPESLSGLSNLTAAYLAEGVKGYPTPEKIEEYIDWNGYQVSTDGGNNTISLEGKLLPMDLDAGLELLAKMAFEPTFPKESLPKLKTQMTLELAAQENNWSSEAFYYYRDVFFGEHPYSRNPTGSKTSLEKITRDDVVRFHDEYLVPSNCVLAIAGPLPADELFEIVQEEFEGYKGSSVNLQEISPPQPKDSSEVFVKETSREQITLMIGFSAPPLLDDDRHTLAVMNNFLSGMKGRLHDELRGVRDLVYLVWGSTFLGPEAGTYYIMTQTSPENYDSVYAIIMHEIERIKEGDFTEEDISMAKVKIREGFYRGRQKQETHVFSAALDELYGLGYDYDNHYLDYIDNVTKEDIIEFANKYLVNPVVALVAPEGFAEKE